MTRGVLLSRLKFLAIIIACFGLLSPIGADAATLSELLARQQELKRQEEQNRLALEQKRQEANTLESAISGLEGDIAYTNNRISNTQDQIDTSNKIIAALNSDIAESNKELDDLNIKLSSAYVTLYEMSQTSTMELILQSNSLDEIVSQTQYIQAIQTDLQNDIERQKEIKAKLEKEKAEATDQKEELERLRNQLSASRTSLNSQKNQKDYLLDVTQGQQSAYQQIIAEIKAEATQVSEEIFRKRQELGGYSTGGNGGYIYANWTPDVPDRWSFLTRECTSYVAFKNFDRWYRNPLAPGVPAGHAKYWPALARDRGIPTGSSPRVGASIVWGEPGKYLNPNYISPSYGHVAYVERVYSSTDIEISEYNWVRFSYSYRRVNPKVFGTPTYIYM